MNLKKKLLTTLETGTNIIEWPSLQYCAMSAFGGDALQRNAMLHKSSFKIIDKTNGQKEKSHHIFKAYTINVHIKT